MTPRQVLVLELSELLDEIEARERQQLKDIKEQNTPAWGMCVGTLETIGELRAWLTQEGP